MGTRTTELRDGCFARALDDEPMFVLLARDESAPGVVDAWADNREHEIHNNRRPSSDLAVVQEARQCARNMRAWREANDGSWRSGLFGSTTQREGFAEQLREHARILDPNRRDPVMPEIRGMEHTFVARDEADTLPPLPAHLRKAFGSRSGSFTARFPDEPARPSLWARFATWLADEVPMRRGVGLFLCVAFVALYGTGLYVISRNTASYHALQQTYETGNPTLYPQD